MLVPVLAHAMYMYMQLVAVISKLKTTVCSNCTVALQELQIAAIGHFQHRIVLYTMDVKIRGNWACQGKPFCVSDGFHKYMKCKVAEIWQFCAWGNRNNALYIAKTAIFIRTIHVHVERGRLTARDVAF